jgi:lipoprotein-anchoring transpeptidase ErfK/SrfK
MTVPTGCRRSVCALLAAAGAAAPAAAPEPALAGGTPSPGAIRAPARDSGATTAQIVAATHARAKPGLGRRRVRRLGTRTTWSGHAQRLLVLDSARRDGRQWLKVLLATRPNGSTGWIPRDKTALEHTPYWLQLRLRTRQLSVYRNGRRIRRFRAVIGAPDTPTPRGLAAIYERNAQPDPKGFLGPWALSLSAFSKVLTDYGGGPGRVAIHGRGADSFRDPLGSARSHGCIRINNSPIRWLVRHAAPGTPIRIRR